jgi:hypothetical protein
VIPSRAANRRYSVEEIDALRAAVHVELTMPPSPDTMAWWGMDDGDLARRIEDRVRTYMLNGTQAEEVTSVTWRRWHEKKFSMFRLGRILVRRGRSEDTWPARGAA